MSKCLNPDCLTQNVSSNNKFCQKCGSKLLLKERYRAIRIIGEGGFGRTFLAIDEDKPSKPSCVIKQFLPQAQGTSNIEKAAELFAQEAARLDELGKHPQIPELLAYFTQDNRQYLIQEFIEGLNLQQELKKEGNFNEQKIKTFLGDVLPILKYVHQNKVIHRDIKPENLIRRGSDKKIFLVDFGASKVIENTRLSVTGTVIGSAQYASPEQSFGKPKYCSDLYSLGVTCLYLLTGIDPFDLYDAGEGDWVWRDYLLNNPLSDELGQVLDKLVQSPYKKRFQSVDEVMGALNLNPVKQSTGKMPILQSNSPAKQPTGKMPIPQSISQSKQPTGKMPVPQSNSQPKIIQPQPTQVQKVYPAIKTPIRQPQKNFTEFIRVGGFFRKKQEIKLEMVAIPAGEFMMGSNESDREKPIHKVRLKEFYMGKYPITQAQYQAVIGENLSIFPSIFGGKNLPVNSVSWNDAQKFCQKLSEMTGKKYTLPSESQWEYACRAGSTTKWCFGDNKSQLKDYAWYYANSIIPTLTDEILVGQKKPNQWGLFDMHGNVWEWCEDNWHQNYQNAPTNGSAWIDKNSNVHVLRGGSWISRPRNCRSACRDFISLARAVIIVNYGFRVVCVSGRTS